MRCPRSCSRGSVPVPTPAACRTSHLADVDPKKLRCLVAAFGDPGHVFPAISLSRELKERGHEVVLETWPQWQETVEGVGRTGTVRAGDPIPLALEAIVMRCLAKDPARRFADAGELVAALSTVDFADLSDGPRMSNPPPSSDEDERSPAMKTSDGRARRPSSSGPARLAFVRDAPTPEKP